MKSLLNKIGAFFLLFFLFFGKVEAQSLGVAEYVEVSEDQIDTGTILVHRNGTYEFSTEPYSKDLVGVVAARPAVEIVPDDQTGKAPLVLFGQALVRVNGENGPLKSGDLVTSSSEAGVGMKANKSGFILGVAQADFTPETSESEAVIPVLLDIKFAFADDAPASERIISRLMSVVSLNTLSFVEEPIKSLKYTAAALAILGSLAISFFTFGRVAQKGVEAIGRNPLAKNSISASVLMNTVLALGFALLGLVTAYIIVTW